MALTRKQMLVLSELRSNSRQSIANIARKLGMPLSTCHDNYKAVKNCITQYCSLIDFAELGYSLRINFTFKAKNIEPILNNKNINSIYRINNKYTFLIECFFRNINEAYELKEKLQELGMKKISMSYIIDEIKKETIFA